MEIGDCSVQKVDIKINGIDLIDGLSFYWAIISVHQLKASEILP